MDGREKTWDGLRAASLSIVPGVGHLYLGRKRGYGFLILAGIVLLVSWFYWPRVEVLYPSLAIFSGFDAYAIAKRGYGLF